MKKLMKIGIFLLLFVMVNCKLYEKKAAAALKFDYDHQESEVIGEVPDIDPADDPFLQGNRNDKFRYKLIGQAKKDAAKQKKNKKTSQKKKNEEQKNKNNKVNDPNESQKAPKNKGLSDTDNDKIPGQNEKGEEKNEEIVLSDSENNASVDTNYSEYVVDMSNDNQDDEMMLGDSGFVNITIMVLLALIAGILIAKNFMFK